MSKEDTYIDNTTTSPSHIDIWEEVLIEAQEIVKQEPTLENFINDVIFKYDNLSQALCHRVANRISHHKDIPVNKIILAFDEVLQKNPHLPDVFAADLTAVKERDPACHRNIEPLIYFMGFHAIQCHRMAHELWQADRKDFALYLQSRNSSVFSIDIHPAAKIGKGIMVDHGAGLVIGGTTVIADEVSILQGVTLGGTGKEEGDRHPKIGQGVLIGSGAKVLGNINVGNYAKIAAGSVVLNPIPDKATVAGVPAKIISYSKEECPAKAMNQSVN